MKAQYVAFDGNVFDTQEECEEYEKTIDYHNYIVQYNIDGEVINTNDWEKVRFIKYSCFPNDDVFNIFLEDTWNYIGQSDWDIFSKHLNCGPGLYQWDYESCLYVKVLEGIKNITW